MREAPKANGFNGQIVELLRHRGLLDRVEAASGRPVGPAPHAPFGGVHLDFSHLADSPIRAVHLPQPRLERLLSEHARELSAEIRHGHEVTGVSQDDGAAAADVRGPEGSYQVRARYLVGCDGAHSKVRDTAGGIGWKVRKYGLALDNVTAADVVTASGEVVHASAAENPELFWAIRGGGGNFGIVTAFVFAAHPTTDVFYGKIAFAASEAATVIQGWADYLRTAPDELTSTVDLGQPVPRTPRRRSRSTSPSTATTRNSRPGPSIRSAGSAR